MLTLDATTQLEFIITSFFRIEWKYILISGSKQMFDRFPFNPNHRKWKAHESPLEKSTCHHEERGNKPICDAEECKL